MSTNLHPSPVFGPVHSRRLGISLGINLMPNDGKICTFDCLYCECGFNKDRVPASPRPSREFVTATLESKLKGMEATGILPDSITFSGNGEPTAHPLFPEIIDDVLHLRDRYCPDAKVSVLSNSTFIHKERVREALMRVDNNILKLDTVNPVYISKLDRPLQRGYDVCKIVEYMKSFNGHVVVQSIFLKGVSEGFDFNNTTDDYVLPWLKAVCDISPRKVMVYTIDRDTPDGNLCKASHEEIDRICHLVKELGMECEAGY